VKPLFRWRFFAVGAEAGPLAGEKILIVDDEAVMREMIGGFLRKEGFRVLTADTGYRALEAVRRERPDLILLDVLLPELDGFELCSELRKETDVPVIFITAKSDTGDVALGLGIGGDDYVTKPFSPAEGVARVKAHLRRYRRLNAGGATSAPERVIKHAGLVIDPAKRTVTVNGAPVTLTAKEFDILTLLARHPDRFFTADQLMELVWPHRESVDHRSLMVHISKLRKKIEPDPANPRHIVTLRGVGYRFNA